MKELVLNDSNSPEGGENLKKGLHGRLTYMEGWPPEITEQILVAIVKIGSKSPPKAAKF